MVRILFLLFISSFLFLTPFHASAQEERAAPRSGEGISAFLQRNGRTGKAYYQEFLELNKKQLRGKEELRLGVKYVLPPLRKGASATASDSLSAAAFIDAYGNNATYDKEDVHYFLINIGASDMGLYRFKDDSGADNNVVADELTPVALFVGLRTEDFTTQDLFNVFIY